MTRNLPNRIPGMIYNPKAEPLPGMARHTADMFKPPVLVSFENEDAMFGKVR
jgi:hypothetical protein